MGGQRRSDPKVESAAVNPPAESAPATANGGDDGDDMPNREFAERVRKELGVSTNAAAIEQLSPYFAGLAKSPAPDA